MVPTASKVPNEVRLALCERALHPSGVDGTWWPASANLRAELPDLVAVLGLRVGPVRRVLYDPAAWPTAPARIIRGNTAISVDPYSMVASDTIYLIGTHSRDAVLFVVPPSTSCAVARRVLGAVAASSDPLDVTSMRTWLREGAAAV